MLNKDTFNSLNIKGQNVLKNDINTISNCFSPNDFIDSIDNYIINSNLNNTEIIK